MQFIQSIDNFILDAIQIHLHSNVMNTIMKFVTNLGNSGFIWFVIAIIFICTKKYRKSGVIMVISVIVCSLLGEGIIKHIVERTRPFYHNQTIHLLITRPRGYSFPSGHTMASFASATIIFKTNKRFGIAAYTLAILIGFSRLYLYVHYPSDVLVGAILGIVCSLIIYSIISKSKRFNLS